ncbi:MAG TPA: amidohydrolase family protein [Vicinamibacterales bacterium]|nr:amidohydrolase family protein [Vicinamibacterales bacterium]
MSTFRADWVLPICDEPIPNGWVAVSGNQISGVGDGPVPDATDLGRVAVLPTLVNAHTHLELSYLHGRVPAGTSFTAWIQTLMALRRSYPQPFDPEIVTAARGAIAAARAAGTGLFGDVSNTFASVPLLRQSSVAAHVFNELLGFNVEDPTERVAVAAAAGRAAATEGSDVRVGLAAHAPYSVSPGMFNAIRVAVDAQAHPVTTVHLGESPDEVEFLQTGGGQFRALLESLGVWAPDWKPPQVSPVRYLLDLGFLDRSVLVVHGVQFHGDDLDRLAALGCTIASCPRSNVHVGVGSPPLEAFYAMDVNVAFGTDSLASVADLNLFMELKEARRIAPRVPARRLLESATLAGARALGFGDQFGSIEPGKRASLIAVRVPEGVDDVEEYLLSGIEPGAITWLDARTSNSHVGS